MRRIPAADWLKIGQNEEKSSFHVDDGTGEEQSTTKGNTKYYNKIEDKKNGNLSLQVTIVTVLEKKQLHFKTLTMAVFLSS